MFQEDSQASLRNEIEEKSMKVDKLKNYCNRLCLKIEEDKTVFQSSLKQLETEKDDLIDNFSSEKKRLEDTVADQKKRIDSFEPIVQQHFAQLSQLEMSNEEKTKNQLSSMEKMSNEKREEIRKLKAELENDQQMIRLLNTLKCEQESATALSEEMNRENQEKISEQATEIAKQQAEIDSLKLKLSDEVKIDNESSKIEKLGKHLSEEAVRLSRFIEDLKNRFQPTPQMDQSSFLLKTNSSAQTESDKQMPIWMDQVN